MLAVLPQVKRRPLILFSLGYYLSVMASEHVYGPLPVPCPFWIPDSILLSALLLSQRAYWPYFLLLVWPLRIMAGPSLDTPLWFLLVSILNDSLKALLSGTLLERTLGRPVRLDKLRDFMIFLGIASFSVPLLSALAAALARQQLGTPFWQAGYQWFMGDMLAQVIVTPALLYWGAGLYRHQNVSRRRGEYFIVFAGVIVVAYYCYGLPHPGPLQPIAVYMPLPFLIWATMRLRKFGIANAILVLALIVMVSASQGGGLFSARILSKEVLVLRMQLFLVLTAIPLLSVAILSSEKDDKIQEFQTLLDATPIEILVATDPEAKHIVANRAAYQIRRCVPGTNISSSSGAPGELPYLILRDGVIVRPEELPVQLATSTGIPVKGATFTLLFKDGTERHMIGNAVPLLDEDGKPRGAVGAFMDRTEQKLAEDALRESEARFRIVLDAMPAMVWMTDTDGFTVFANKAWVDFTGGSETDQLGHGWASTIHPDDRELCVATLTKAVESGTPYESTARARRADGHYRWISSYAVPRRDSKGTYTGYTGASFDITERKLMEDALRESEARFRLVADNSPVLIWMSDETKLCTFFSKGWLDFTGRRLDEELGHGWASGVHPDDFQGCFDTYSRSFDARRPFEMEYRLRRFDGQYRWILDYGVPRFDSGGSFRGYIGSAIDVTERRSAAEHLRGLSGRLIHAQEEERARIARELHDDVGQRLSVVQVSIEMLEQDHTVTPASVRERLQAIAGMTNQIASQLHNFSRELHPPSLAFLGLDTALRGLCREFSERHQIKVSFTSHSVPADLPRDVGLCAYRIVQEALQNVAKHSGTAEATVELSVEGPRLDVRISDEGVGFDLPTVERQQGGLGLVSMRERLRLLGGTFFIRAAPSRGAQVLASIPLHPNSEQGPSNDEMVKSQTFES